MTYSQTMAALTAKRAEIGKLRQEMRALQAAVEPQAVEDWELTGWNGSVRLSGLFGGKEHLILIHNMGRSCSSCTMWADGYNGLYDHLASRVGFVVSSPDTVEVQRAFSAGRGWRFPMVSHAGTDFAAKMGYREPGAAGGGWWPGISTFRMAGGQVMRLSDTQLGPMDDFNPFYHLMELSPGGDANFTPKFSYG